MARINQKGPGHPARGTRSGRPVMVLLDVLGERWTLRVLWELHQEGATFRGLQQHCEGVSPTVLNKRLKTLRELRLVAREEGSGYKLTELGGELAEHLLPLHRWAERWARALEEDGR